MWRGCRRRGWRVAIVDDFARGMVMGMLAKIDPDNHLVTCPDAVVLEGDRLPDEPDPGGGRWITLVWSVSCGHGRDVVKLTSRLLAERDPFV